MSKKQKLIALAKVSPKTIENWRKSKPELIQAMESYLHPEPRIWIRVKSSFFEDDIQRAFPLEQDSEGIFFTHADKTTTRLESLPPHLYVLESGTQYENHDTGLFL